MADPCILVVQFHEHCFHFEPICMQHAYYRFQPYNLPEYINPSIHVYNDQHFLFDIEGIAMWNIAACSVFWCLCYLNLWSHVYFMHVPSANSDYVVQFFVHYCQPTLIFRFMHMEWATNLHCIGDNIHCVPSIVVNNYVSIWVYLILVFFILPTSNLYIFFSFVCQCFIACYPLVSRSSILGD